MKFSALIIAGAGLLQASAIPLRVAILGTEGSLSPQTGSNDESVARIHSNVMVNVMPNTDKAYGHRRGCSRFRQKAIEISNSLRESLGMPLIQTEYVHAHSHSGGKEVHGETFHILPFLGTPSDFAKLHKDHEEHRVHFNIGEGPHKMHLTEDDEHKHHHHHRHHKFRHSSGHFPRPHSFMRRIHFALMTLGPWEGRAVAFVLGCGLGVLLRMFWVLTVISYRAIRGSNEDEEIHYIPVPNQHDAEEIFVAPPVYIVDEKAPLREEMKAAEETN